MHTRVTGSPPDLNRAKRHLLREIAAIAGISAVTVERAPHERGFECMKQKRAAGGIQR